MKATNYQGMLLPPDPNLNDLQELAPDYEAMLLSIMTVLADRYEKTTDYPFIDTKLDLLTGKDFSTDDLVRGRPTIYGWIQGRGLEALAGHCSWMRRRGLNKDLLQRLETILKEVLQSIRDIRQRNQGHLSFFMTPKGEAFSLDDTGNRVIFTMEKDSPYGTTDLFSAKGIYKAACYLGDETLVKEAVFYLGNIDSAIWSGKFVNDQKQLDPKNPVEPRPGHFPHGSFMLQIGTAALLAENGDRNAVEMGLKHIRHELTHYINLKNKIPELQEYDMWEAIDCDNQPYRNNGKIISDPGHATELVGLILKFLQTLEKKDLLEAKQQKECHKLKGIILKVFFQNFKNGYRAGPGGICKSYDLVSGHPINTDMPWWNLPETLRVAVLGHNVAENVNDRQHCLSIFSKCHNAFTRHYVLPNRFLMAVQTRNAKGHAIAVIPATPDADPGYHTGLSIIDVLNLFDSWKSVS